MFISQKLVQYLPHFDYSRHNSKMVFDSAMPAKFLKRDVKNMINFMQKRKHFKLVFLKAHSLKPLFMHLLLLLILLISCSNSSESNDTFSQGEGATTEQSAPLNGADSDELNATNLPLPISTAASTSPPDEIPTLPPIEETPLSGLEAMIAESRNKLFGTTWVLSGFEPFGSGPEIPLAE